MGKSIRINKTTISEQDWPYIIAEIGVNHENSLDQAKRLIELAKQGGASAAKFQTYKADKLASNNSPAYWDTSKETTLNQRELFSKYDQFGEAEYTDLAKYCQKIGIDFLSTPFDEDAVDFLDPLVPAFKVASADITNLPLLRKIGAKNKPVILSTGASTVEEIRLAFNELSRSGAEDVILLHCVLNYPTEDCGASLKMIKGLASEFPETLIGYSDHTLPYDDLPALQVSYLNGAVVLEKHFTHDKKLKGNDHYHAMDVDDLRRFTCRMRQIISMQGFSENKKPLKTEQQAILNARRSIVLNCKIEKGTKLSSDLLTCKRPGFGISPIHWEAVTGMTLNKSLPADHILTWSDLD